jgi:hypothetical protein
MRFLENAIVFQNTLLSKPKASHSAQEIYYKTGEITEFRPELHTFYFLTLKVFILG